MLASQFIYTACGKDKTGAFSVWAKSADITKAESDEIAKMMLYKRPADLPYEPTQEEIDTLFPKKTGYFLLSSGRYCVAQSTYIGKVYSDQDMRSGNYIIHAFVLDDVQDFQPMTLFNADLFKTSLTYDEWHEHDAPEDLPRVEVPSRMDAMSKSTIDSFFTDERCQRLQWLLQGVVSAYYNNDKVTFHDVEANLKYWYKAISLCLPRSMEKKLTFCSFFTPLPPIATQNTASGAEEVKLRNVSPTVLASLFSYAQEVRSGRFAFDFANNVVNENISVSRYVKTVVTLMRKNLFEALMMVDEVDKLMIRCGCTLDEAADLYNLRKGNFEWFLDLAELMSVTEKARNLIPEAMGEIADGLYGYCICQDRWPCSAQILPLYRLVFDFSEKADKGQIVEKFLYNQGDFGINQRLDCESYAQAVVDTAPFLWVNFVDYIFEKDNMNRFLAANRDNFNAWYLVYVTLVDALKTLDDRQKQFAHEYFLKLMGRAMQTQSTEQFDVLLKGIRKLGSKWETWLIQNSLAALMTGGKKLTEVCDTHFLLNLICRLSSQEVALLILKELAMENLDNASFIETYVNKTGDSRDLFDRYEAELGKDPAFKQFLENVEMQRFSLKGKLTRGDLNKYYRQFYAPGKDRGLFLKKLNGYLSTVSDNALMEECQDLYEQWFAPLPDDHPQLAACVTKLADTMFDLPFATLLKYADKVGLRNCEPVLERLEQIGGQLPEQYLVLKLGMDIRSAGGKRRSKDQDVEQKLEDKSFFKVLRSPGAVDLFVEHFLADMIPVYMFRFENVPFETVMEACFEDLADSRKFSQTLRMAMDKLDKKDYEVFVTELFCYSVGQKTHLAGRMIRVLNAYLDDVGRGKRKKIFDFVESRVDENYDKEVTDFITKYEKEHEGFFSRIFGGSKKKEAKEKPDKKDKKDKKAKHQDEAEDETEDEAEAEEQPDKRKSKDPWEKPDKRKDKKAKYQDEDEQSDEEPLEPEEQTNGGKRKWKK